MQDLIDRISHLFNLYLNSSIALIPEQDFQEIGDKVSQYLVLESEKTSDIQVLKKEFLVNKFCGGTYNILHIAAKFGDSDHLQGLIEIMGADFLNIPDKDSRTPLHHCSIGGSLENAILLMNEGADLMTYSSRETRKWLPIHHASKSGCLKLVEEMINRGVNPDERTFFGLNCLHIACENGNYEIAEMLLIEGLDVNSKTFENSLKLTPLHYSVIKKLPKLIELLFAWQAERNIQDDESRTCLDFAAHFGYEDLVDYLLAHGILSYENAFLLAKSKCSDSTIQKIQSYRNFTSSLFGSRFLKCFAPLLEESIALYADGDFEDPKIALDEGNMLNAFGILGLKKSVGFFNRKPISLLEFARDNRINSLESCLQDLQKRIQAPKKYPTSA